MLKISKPQLIWLYSLLALSYLINSTFFNHLLMPLHKALPILLLACCSYLWFRGRLRIGLLLALLCSACGDIILATKLQHSFVLGLASFAVAQLAYSLSFARWRSWSGAQRWLLLPLALYLLVVAALVLPNTSQLTVAVLVYMAIISSMATLAIMASPANYLLIFAASSFVVSDSLIALDQFVSPLPYAHLWVMLSYYAAQLGILLACLKQSQSHAR